MLKWKGKGKGEIEALRIPAAPESSRMYRLIDQRRFWSFGRAVMSTAHAHAQAHAHAHARPLRRAIDGTRVRSVVKPVIDSGSMTHGLSGPTRARTDSTAQTPMAARAFSEGARAIPGGERLPSIGDAIVK